MNGGLERAADGGLDFPANGGLDFSANGDSGLRTLGKLLRRRGCLDLVRRSEPLGRHVEVLGVG